MSGLRHFSVFLIVAAIVAATVSLATPGAVAKTAPSASRAAVSASGPPGNILQYPCNAPFGSVQISAAAWDAHVTNTGHDGANFNVYSNYRAGGIPPACDRSWQASDGMDKWGEQYQCAELAVRVADGEWGTGNYQAWINAGWDGAAAGMRAPGQKLGLTWTANGSGSLPAPGDLMIWSSSGQGDPGHVAVVSSVTGQSVTFVGENQGFGMVTLPASGSTVENDGWKFGSTILGWLSQPSWQATAAPLPANAASPPSQAAVLSAVTCTGASSCLAAGYYFDSSGDKQGLLETLSGSAWTPTEAPLPAGAAAYADVVAESVACATGSSCAMTGYYNDASGNQQGMLDTLSGAAWTTAEAPLPPGAVLSNQSVYPASVACPSTSSCMAVGWYGSDPGCGPVPTGNGDVAVLWTESANSWTATAAPLPSGVGSFPISCLRSIACPSATSCVAVGYYVDASGNYLGLVETLSGTTWTATEAPVPANAAANPGVGLGPVTCVAVSSCVAIGSYLDASGNGRLLVETLSGTTWTAAEAPGPANATYGVDEATVLNTLACFSITACSAAGDYIDTSGDIQGLLETLSGTTWTPTEAPLPAGALPNNEPNVTLPSVSCPLATSCVAVGDFPPSSGDDQGLLETGSGTTWAPMQAPLPAGTAATAVDLQSVACPSVSSCVAVGWYGDSGLLLAGPG
jgi:hypothetical protein